ncbi:ubiquitin carboxyl-terminal hydrolase [Thecamonas trahens ATCC 50062]|uniref:ubiquitinyl hydrolase 1 n=1 Tax=Thecamonas trahens ATCC 50062 TaxID=461836 RepID=A0A0L0D8N0_THETB|nr:ubiquitin carboxyl-terminal hydrolase [Thecamonas trahens ATCC 50062]KNC48565.1 ubiquitin carboxyl-terminal hydrolase [Thecamonas trahens ATCC 50062]|eukprot:XP_013762621.1 ubiquitin carboxyl-terminal hydrolase [Thecamonas trahens ATCC 50062]
MLSGRRQLVIEESSGEESGEEMTSSAVAMVMSGESGASSSSSEPLFAEGSEYIVPRSELELEWHEKLSRSGVRTGLVNFGVTCYMNSTLQCLTYLPAFSQYLVMGAHPREEECPIRDFCLACQMRTVVGNMLLGKKAVYSPKSLHRNLRHIGRVFHKHRQEDSHEFLRFVVDKLSDVDIETAAARRRQRPTGPAVETTGMHAIFGGHLQSSVKCPQCKRLSVTKEPYLDISLHIAGCRSLESALKQFTRPETLDAHNKYYCGKCTKSVRAVKTLQLLNTPPVLVCHLKRFRGMRKNADHIAFPPKLSLDAFMVNSPPVPPSELPRYKQYSLAGVVVHHGHTISSGHYVAYVRAPNGSWFLCNDRSVKQVSIKTVLAQQAYILFYTATEAERLSPAVIDAVTAATHKRRAKAARHAARRASARTLPRSSSHKSAKAKTPAVQQKRKLSRKERRAAKKAAKKAAKQQADMALAYRALEAEKERRALAAATAVAAKSAAAAASDSGFDSSDAGASPRKRRRGMKSWIVTDSPTPSAVGMGVKIDRAKARPAIKRLQERRRRKEEQARQQQQLDTTADSGSESSGEPPVRHQPSPSPPKTPKTPKTHELPDPVPVTTPKSSRKGKRSAPRGEAVVIAWDEARRAEEEAPDESASKAKLHRKPEMQFAWDAQGWEDDEASQAMAREVNRLKLQAERDMLKKRKRSKDDDLYDMGKKRKVKKDKGSATASAIGAGKRENAFQRVANEKNARRKVSGLKPERSKKSRAQNAYDKKSTRRMRDKERRSQKRALAKA